VSTGGGSLVKPASRDMTKRCNMNFIMLIAPEYCPDYPGEMRSAGLLLRDLDSRGSGCHGYIPGGDRTTKVVPSSWGNQLSKTKITTGRTREGRVI
jgi:hypothetical protein